MHTVSFVQRSCLCKPLPANKVCNQLCVEPSKLPPTSRASQQHQASELLHHRSHLPSHHPHKHQAVKATMYCPRCHRLIAKALNLPPALLQHVSIAPLLLITTRIHVTSQLNPYHFCFNLSLQLDSYQSNSAPISIPVTRTAPTSPCTHNLDHPHKDCTELKAMLCVNAQGPSTSCL